MEKVAVILIGPPGSGKDTQAYMLEKELELVHVKTSKIIEERFEAADPEDEAIKMEKRRWATGELNTRDFVVSLVKNEIERIFKEGRGIIFSGSPRELEEAKAEIPVLEKLYGKDNIYIIHIGLSEEESVKRNSHRRICQKNRHPIPNLPEYQNITECPKDGSPIITRQIDDEKIIRHRYKVYLELTEPVFDFFIKQNYKIINVNGEQSIEKIHTEIADKLKTEIKLVHKHDTN